jgi:hypothetical protein
VNAQSRQQPVAYKCADVRLLDEGRRDRHKHIGAFQTRHSCPAAVQTGESAGSMEPLFSGSERAGVRANLSRCEEDHHA